MSCRPSPELVPLQEADAEQVASWVTDEKDLALFAGPGLSHPLTGERFLATATGEVYALRHGPATVATGTLSIQDQRTARIGRVLVAPSRRGQGLGRAIMERLIRQAATHPDVQAITLGVYEHNHSARGLYESLGFIDTGDRTSIQVANETWHSLQLRRPLTADPL